MSSFRTFLAGNFKNVFRVGLSVVQWAALLHCATEYVADFVICSGPSMEPTIKTNDVIVTEHITPSYGQLSRSDIVVSRSPCNPKQYICKRIVGIAGDQVMTGDGEVIEIPKGHVWVEGDNVYNSTDSRLYGPIPIGLIRGRALLRIWPLADIRWLMTPKENHY